MHAPADAQFISDVKARLEAESAGRPFLLYRDGDERQQLFVLPAGSAGVSVGRLPPADLLLEWDDQVSRLHARFEPARDEWEVVDDGLSRNGTFVNEERLRGRRRLRDGDTLRFGATVIAFRSPEPSQGAGRDAAGPPSPSGLSTTQRRVLVALCRPYKGRAAFASPATDEQIAEELFLSVGVVQTHLSVLRAKLGVEGPPGHETRVRLVERAISAGLISDGDF